jgi:hypothetical protein
MSSSIADIYVHSTCKEALKNLELSSCCCLMHCGISIHINIEGRHLLFEQNPNNFVETFVTCPVKRCVLAHFPGILGLDEGVIVILFVVALGLILGVNRATTLLVQVRSNGVVFNQ